MDTLLGPSAALADYVIAVHNHGIRGAQIGEDLKHLQVPCWEWPAIQPVSVPGTTYCWHDAHPIDVGVVPVFMPVSHDDTRDYFWVYGMFCSFACAIKFAHVKSVIPTQYTMMLLRLMASKMYFAWTEAQQKMNVAAPARESLRAFGNTGRSGMSIEDFRRSTSTTNFRKPPFLSCDNVNFRIGTQERVDTYEHILLYKEFGENASYMVISTFRAIGTELHEGISASAAASVCWHDTYPLDPNNAIVGIPMSHDFDKKSYSVYGIFCSIECAAGYLLEHRDWNVDEQMVLLHRMAHEVFHIPENIIVHPAPPAWDLTRFGGDLDIYEFRETYCSVGTISHHELALRRDQLEHMHHYLVAWKTVSVEYSTMDLPTRYVSLRNIGITNAQRQSVAIENFSNGPPIDEMFQQYMNIRETDEVPEKYAASMASVDEILAKRKVSTGTSKRAAKSSNSTSTRKTSHVTSATVAPKRKPATSTKKDIAPVTRESSKTPPPPKVNSSLLKYMRKRK